MAIDYQRLEKNLTREFRQYHVVAQFRRVIFMFLGALGLQLKDGWHDWTWKGIYALGLAAAYGTALHFAPTVPWKTFLGHVKVAQVIEAQKIAHDAVAAATPAPSPASEQVYTPVTQPAHENQPPGQRPDSAPTP